MKRIRDLARATYTPGVLSDIGSFGGMFACDFGMKEPVLVSSTDGVGTKLKIAMMMNRHNTVGADLVNHCINDILVQGARPLFFMDYVATGKLDPDVDCFRRRRCGQRRARLPALRLLGGETAEMPGFYADGDYDIAGFIVGVVDRSKVIDGKSIRHGDVLIGLPSVGLHTNGYSLARKLFFEVAGLNVNSDRGWTRHVGRRRTAEATRQLRTCPAKGTCRRSC